MHPRISNLATVVEGDPKGPFLLATTPRCRVGQGATPSSGLLYITLDPCLIILSKVLSCGIKYHFFEYDLTWDWTPVFRFIGEHSTHKTLGRLVHKRTSLMSSYFFSCAPHGCFVLLGWFMRWEVSGCTAAVFWVNWITSKIWLCYYYCMDAPPRL